MLLFYLKKQIFNPYEAALKRRKITFKRNISNGINLFKNIAFNNRRKNNNSRNQNIGKWWWKDKEIDLVAFNEQEKKLLF